MPLVTFTSDFGSSDHYVASVKAKLLALDPDARIIDIAHDIEPFDLSQLAFTVRAVFRDFPTGTIHLLGVNDNASGKYIAAELEEHLFLLPDNGLIGLLSEKAPIRVVVLNDGMKTLSPTSEVLVPAAGLLLKGTSIDAIGEPIEDYKRMMMRSVKATRSEIAGHVIRVDHYGNLITNIKKVDFDILSKDKNFTVHLGRENSKRVHQSYQDVDPGELFFVFNSLGLMEIGINQGHAGQLLGLGFDAPVNIQFQD